MIDIKKLQEIIEKRATIGTMSRDYGHHVDDILHIEHPYELQQIDNAIDELERLQKKEVAVKVLNNNDVYIIGICPICKKNFEVYEDGECEYCPRCGQKLDWSDEK